jgi:hypothetical protein
MSSTTPVYVGWPWAIHEMIHLFETDGHLDLTPWQPTQSVHLSLLPTVAPLEHEQQVAYEAAAPDLKTHFLERSRQEREAQLAIPVNRVVMEPVNYGARKLYWFGLDFNELQELVNSKAYEKLEALVKAKGFFGLKLETESWFNTKVQLILRWKIVTERSGKGRSYEHAIRIPDDALQSVG